MKPVDQTIVDSGTGNCMQAVFASLFEQKLEDAINIFDYPRGEWMVPFMEWSESVGYEYQGILNMFVDPLGPVTRQSARRDISQLESVGGYFYGVVASKTYENTTHAVIIDSLGIVVHDPNPNKAWQGVDTISSKDLLYIYTFGKIKG